MTESKIDIKGMYIDYIKTVMEICGIEYTAEYDTTLNEHDLDKLEEETEHAEEMFDQYLKSLEIDDI